MAATASSFLDARVEAPRVDIGTYLGVIWSGLGISVLFVSIRLFARFKVFGRLYADDAIVIFALSLALASAIVSQIFAESLFQLMLVLGGRRLPSPSFVADSEGFLKASLAVIIFYYSTLWAIKISFLVFFKRLIKNVRRQELMWWPIFGFTMATYFVCMGIIPYNCLVSPLQQSMVICTKDSAVRFQRISLISICVWDVVTDFLIMLIPTSMLWGSQMRPKRKMALAFIFSLVIITITTSIARTTVVSLSTHLFDPSWLSLWSAIEVTVAIIVACLASFRSLFSHQESASQPTIYSPTRSHDKFLHGGISGRNLITDTGDSLTGNSSHKTHIQSGGMNPRNTERRSSSLQLIIPLDSVHIKQEFSFSHDTV